MSKTRETITDTACHVIKGAIVTVLNCPLTISVECNNKVKGRISVEYTSTEKPTDDQVKKIEEEANRIIKANIPIQAITLDRKEAEEKYTKEKVNNTYIYDKFPVPESVTTLTIVEIKDWNVNCCPAKHLESTGQVGGVKITGINHRPQKKELEFRFDIVSVESIQAEQAKKAAEEKKKQQDAERAKRDATNVDLLTQKIVDMVLANAGDRQKLDTVTVPHIKTLLSSLKNMSYTNGMNASN